MAVNSLSQAELELLRLLNDPEKWFEINAKLFPIECHYIIQLICAAFQEYTQQELELLIQLLVEKELIDIDYTVINTYMTADGIKYSRTTEAGKKMLNESYS